MLERRAVSAPSASSQGFGEVGSVPGTGMKDIHKIPLLQTLCGRGMMIRVSLETTFRQ